MGGLFSSSNEKNSAEHAKALRTKRTIRDKRVEADYIVKPDIIGRGEFSVVKVCECKKTNQRFAVKYISKPENAAAHERLERELTIWRGCDHPNIIAFHEDYERNHIHTVVMDLAEGGELFEQIVKHEQFCEKFAANMITSILHGVRYLHSRNIVHRDIKPENLLLSTHEFPVDGSEDVHIRICDFGIAVTLESPSQRLTEVLGSPGYIAPEVLQCRTLSSSSSASASSSSSSSDSASIGYTFSPDIWGIGVILYILISGFPPFHGDNEAEIYHKTLNEGYQLSPWWDDISAPGKDFLSHLLEKDPAKRYTADQCLEHEWIKNRAHISKSSSKPKTIERSVSITKLIRETPRVESVLSSDSIDQIHELRDP